MAKAEFHETLAVERDALFETIVGYEAYPAFVDGCTRATVEMRDGPRARVKYDVNVLKSVTYTLELQEDREKGQVSWELVTSDFFKVNRGHWRLKAAGPGKTDVLYAIEVEFKVPVPGFMLNRLVKGSLPAMVKSFQKRANG